MAQKKVSFLENAVFNLSIHYLFDFALRSNRQGFTMTCHGNVLSKKKVAFG